MEEENKRITEEKMNKSGLIEEIKAEMYLKEEFNLIEELKRKIKENKEQK